MNRLKLLNLKFKIASLRAAENFPVVDRPKCFIFLAADYGNLGDVAITYAQKRFLQENFPGYEVVEVPAAATLKYINSIRKQISPEDIVTVVGGGNMGDMYGDIELLRLMVVKKFRNNRIILFPQTIDYSASSEAMWLKKLSRRIYGSSGNLTMCAREKVSYDTMCRLYPGVDVRLSPDIVMGRDESQGCGRQNVATFCLREDMEKADNEEAVSQLREQCKIKGLQIEYYDTHIGGNRYTEDEKYFELRKIWHQFSRSKLVITDRLHGMIFAYITRTPAIVLPNSNFKVAGCYEWIKDCGYIKFFGEGNVDLRSFPDNVVAKDIKSRITGKLKNIL